MCIERSEDDVILLKLLLQLERKGICVPLFLLCLLSKILADNGRCLGARGHVIIQPTDDCVLRRYGLLPPYRCREYR